MSYRKWIIAALLCFAAAPAWAAQAPITLEANYLQYNDETGDMMADGHVRLNQEQTKIFSEHITGNIKTGDILAEGQVTWTEETKTMTGEKLNYNYKTKEGTMGTSKGNLDGQLVTAQSTILHPENSESYKATVTKCPAKIPDYKMTAEKVVIYPGDKLIAYNAAFWIKNTKIYSMHKYVKKLDKKEQESSMPSLGYSSDDGFLIKQHLEYPVNDKVTGFADLRYFTKRGFENQFGLAQNNTHSSLSVVTGSTQNWRGDWYKRKPEITYMRYGMPIGDTRLSYAYQLQAVQIYEDTTNQGTWQESATLWLAHDPIKLAAKTSLNLGTYYAYSWYESDVKRNVFGYNAAVYHQLNNKMSLVAGYNYINQSLQSPFTYDYVDLTRELTTQFNWKIDRLWNVAVTSSYDLEASRFHEISYTLKRNLHCFEAEITYIDRKDNLYLGEKGDELRFRLRTIQW